ncbi:MAG: S-layer homology domain-containing protein, partial [Ruminococcus sp.]|nr:S-layer homology domain-containing protein [Ruminococcus sp.]
MNKNLKKVISTVAALALSASAVSAFAVNFPDVPEDASYAQAVQELSALKVISGFDDGTFRPDELVTRAQMAKMIVDALAETEQAEASKAVTQFADVAQDHWAKGYINQGVADTFISGYGDGNFGPEDNVTYVQAQSMLVRAIGYQTYAEGSGGWPNGYKTWAASQGITTGISGIADDTQLTRAQVAQLVDNAMGAPICVIKDYETTIDGRRVPNLEIKDDEGKDYQTLFTKKHDAYKVFGRVTDTNKTNSSIATDQVSFKVEKADNFDDEYYKGSTDDAIDIDAYYGDTKAPEMLRTYAEALIQQDENDEWNILSIVAAAANKSVTVAAEDFDEGKSDNTDNKLYFYPAGTTKNSTKYELADEFAVYVNGKSVDYDYETLCDYIEANETASVTLQKETKKGSTSTDSKYNLVQISSYKTVIVSDVIVKSDQITINFDEQGADIKGNKMVVYLDDDSYSYDFTFE